MDFEQCANCNVNKTIRIKRTQLICNDSGVAVYFYPEGKERVQFKGVKSEEGLSKFLIKNLGDSILVSVASITFLSYLP